MEVSTMWKHFKYDEFKCPCCRENKTSHKLIDLLDQAREKAGIAFVITSGYRCEKHNREVGGVENSAHTKGLAADIQCLNSQDRYRIVKALLEVGFRRIGIGRTFIHVDIDDSKIQNVIWLY